MALTTKALRSWWMGLRSVFGILEAMKLDVANHQIRTLRPFLVNNAAEFEREHFQKRIQKGVLCIRGSQEWFLKVVSERQPKSASIDYLFCLTEGVLSILTP